ncbi:MAG: ABC transporter substrate-binding protein [Myxococcota bacterium]
MLVSSLSVVLSSSCKKSDGESGGARSVEVLIDWQAEPTYVGVYYAKTSGLFSDEGYDVTIVESWGANRASAAVASGRYKVGTASGGASVLAVDKGAPIVSTAVINRKISTVIYGLATTKLDEPTDLYGKTVGMYAGSINVNEFEAFIHANGLDRAKITQTVISGNDLAPLKAGSIDVALNYRELSPTRLSLDQTAPEVAGKRMNYMMLNQHGVDGYGLNVISSRAALRESPKLVNAVTKAIVSGYKNGCANQGEAVAQFMELFPQKDREYIAKGWAVTCEQLEPLDGIGRQDQAGWSSTIAMFEKEGLLKSEPASADMMP